MNALTQLADLLNQEEQDDPRLPVIRAAMRKRSQLNPEDLMPRINPEDMMAPEVMEEDTRKALDEDRQSFEAMELTGKLYPEGWPGVVESDGRRFDGTRSGIYKDAPPQTENELAAVHKEINKDDKNSHRSAARDFYSNDPKMDADFERAARSNDPIKAYKRLQRKYGITEEEMDDMIQSYSAQ